MIAHIEHKSDSLINFLTVYKDISLYIMLTVEVEYE